MRLDELAHYLTHGAASAQSIADRFGLTRRAAFRLARALVAQGRAYEVTPAQGREWGVGGYFSMTPEQRARAL